MIYKLFTVSVLVLLSAVTFAQKTTGFNLVERTDKKQVDILYNNKLLTAYCFYDSIRKSILFPVNTVDGITVTRGYPIQSVAGERTDHPHHNGIWLNYESVNGLDFWNNSSAIPVEKRSQYGTIKHQKVIDKKAAGNNASLTVATIWMRPDNKVLMNEQTTFNFSVSGSDFTIDRRTTLTAADIPVVFKDVKDGMLAIRVARELEMPSKEPAVFVDDKGIETKVPPSGTGDVTGMYINSNGVKGDSVWSTKGKWCILTGQKQGKDITIAMIDHPSNVGYPTYWHARGYGLFALNPLGREVFSKGAEKLNFTLQPQKSTTMRYRIIIHSGSDLTKEQMDKQAADFAKFK
ncbi:MAG: PmoA family protein [Segetibacter sp.]